MKSGVKILPIITICLLFGSAVDLRAQEEALPTAILEGGIQQFEGRPGGRQIRCLVPQLTVFRPEMIRTRVGEGGAFRLEVPVYQYQEVWLQYLGKTIPLLAGPGDSLHLVIDAGSLSGNGHLWATVKVSGSREVTNRQLLAYLGNFPYRIEGARAADGRREPEAYREETLSLLEASLDELKSYRKGHFMNDTVYDWAVQDLRFTAARNLFIQAHWRADHVEDEYLVYRLADSGYFKVWEPFKEMEPPYALSWAYRQFLSTYINFLNYKMTKAFAPDYEEMDAAAREEFLYVYGDSIVMAGIEHLIDHPPSLFRDHSLALFCGNLLQLNAPVIKLSYVQAIRDDKLRRRVREKFDKSRSKTVELKDPSLLVVPPDTVRDIVAWAGRHYEGRVVLLDFWAVWCGSCLYSIENELPELVEKFKEEPVVFLLVGVGSERNFLIERANRFPVQTAHLFPTAGQEEVLKSTYEIKGLPRYILLGKNGEIIDDYAPKPGPELAERIAEVLND
jgi:thiol-disulfide isomerase/thioredoxin